MISVFFHATETCGKQNQQKNAVRQGIISNNGCTENCIKMRIEAKDKSASNA